MTMPKLIVSIRTVEKRTGIARLAAAASVMSGAALTSLPARVSEEAFSCGAQDNASRKTLRRPFGRRRIRCDA
jgi:hypothetical protein